MERAHQRLAELKRQRRDFEDTITTLMVMEELPEPRATFLLRRGAYDAPGERVERGVPAALPPLKPPGGSAAHLAPKSNRLDLARWLISPQHPLTARVAVNRFWQMLFGTGLVKTVEDFGSQGEMPSHPELLDWLAVEFMWGAGERESERQGDKGTTK